MMAHQVIFIPAKSTSNTGAQGTVYVFGGLETSRRFQVQNFKYDIAENRWTRLPDWDWKAEMHRYSFNLLPLCNFRLILVVSSKNNLLFDTERDIFIKLAQEGIPDLTNVQIGAFTLPTSYGADRTNK